MVSSPAGIHGTAKTDSVPSLSLPTAVDYQSSVLTLPNSPLFGTDGIRGRVGDLLTASLALQIGFWAGVVLRKHSRNNAGPVLVGQDSRNSSDMLAMAVASGLASSGLEVWHLGLCPTPCVAYLTSMTNATGGVMISASHNPPADNGIKFFGSDGTKLSQAWQEEIEAGVRSQTAPITRENAWGRCYLRSDLVKNYVEGLQQPLATTDFAQMRIVLDLAWGAAVDLAPTVFREMGAEVICLHDRADGDRINVDCGSTHLASLQATVLEQRATLGFAFDGDADRVLAVDDRGRAVDGDYILYLWGQALQKQQQLPDNLIVSTVMANLGFERAWQKIGGKMIRTSVGDQYVQAEMMRTGGMLGGEQSGHILCRHYGMTGDGMLTALHIAALVQQAQVPLSEMVDQSFTTYPQLLRNVRVEDRDRRMNWKECTAVQNAIAQAEAAMGDQGRILVRASGTEPVIRVMVEAAKADLTQYWTDNLVLAVQQHLSC